MQWDGETHGKVKRVWKLRDWSGELDENDVPGLALYRVTLIEE